MAQLRLWFGQGAPKLLNYSRFRAFAVGSKHAKTILPTASVFTFAQLIKTHYEDTNDLASVRGSCTKCYQTSFERDTSGKMCVLDDPVLSQTRTFSDYWSNGVNVPLTEANNRVQVVPHSSVSRSGVRTFFRSGGHGPKAEGTRCLHTRAVFGGAPAAGWRGTSDRCLIRAYSSSSRNGNQDTPLYKSKTGYYDILEVPSTATQAQIKTAYYKQSFIYHPDKNTGREDATFLFAQITEAYHVLGNKALRKKYDRGTLSQTDAQGNGRPSSVKETASKSAGQQTRARHSPRVFVDPKNVFDFDAFFRAHYGEQLQREKDARAQRLELLKKKKEQWEPQYWEPGRMTEIAVGMIVAMAAVILLTL